MESAEFYENLALLALTAAEQTPIFVEDIARLQTKAQVYATLAVAAAQPQSRWTQEVRETRARNLAKKAGPGEDWCGEKGPWLNEDVHCNLKPHRPDGHGAWVHMAIDDDGNVGSSWGATT